MYSKVSIIIPLYNSDRFLIESFQSIASQTYTNWELIIVDDLSTDDSYQIAQDLAATDSRIIVFQLNSNSGAAMARNKAIELAKGRFIAFLDSDDLWHPEKLEKQVNFMLKNEIAFSYTVYEKIDEQGTPYQTMFVPEKINYNSLLKTNVIGCLTAMYDTEILGKVYMPTSTKREDFATWLQILKKVDYAYGLNESLAQYRVYDAQSSSKKVNMAKENWRLYKDIEKLGAIKSIYYFAHYSIRGLLRSKFPRIARVLGVLN